MEGITGNTDENVLAVLCSLLLVSVLIAYVKVPRDVYVG